MAFIEKAGNILSQVLKKTVEDPDKVGKGLELLVRGATLPDPDDSTGDFRATGRALGRFRQEQRKRDQEDIAAANAAKRKAEEAAKLKEYMFQKSELDRELEYKTGIAQIKERGEQKRSERDYALRGAESTRKIAKDATDNWMNFAANTDKIPYHMWGVRDEKGQYKPTSYAIDVFTKAKLFGFGEEIDFSSKEAFNSSMAKRIKQKTAFNKFMKAADQRYNTQKRKDELDATPKTTVEKRLPGQLDITRSLQTSFGRRHVKPLFVDKSSIGKEGDVPTRIMEAHAAPFLRSALTAIVSMSQSPDVTDEEIRMAGFDNREKYKDFVENFNSFKKITSRGETIQTKDIQRQARAFTEIIRTTGLEKEVKAALNSVKKGETSEGTDDSGNKVTITNRNLGYFKSNDLWAEVAINLGVLTEQDLVDIKDLKGKPAIEAKGATPDGTPVTANATSPAAAKAMAVAGALQTDEIKNLVRDSSTDLRDKFNAFTQKVEKEYPSATLGQKEDMFFEFVNLIEKMDPDGKKFLDRGGNVYQLAAMYIYQGMPHTKRKVNPRTEQVTLIAINLGMNLRKTDGTPTPMGAKLIAAEKNTNKLNLSLGRIRSIVEATKADFARSGGVPNGSSLQVLMGRPAEAALNIEAFGRFFTSMKDVISNYVTSNAGLDRVKSQFLDYNKIDTKERFGFEVEHNSRTKEILIKHDLTLKKGNKEILDQYNAVMENTKSDAFEKAKAQDTFLRRAALLWEKTALTYQLAGYVQGEQTGGRTISNQDFDNIYRSLWGGTFYSEDSARNAIRILSFTNEQMSKRLSAERYALTSLGHGLAGNERLRSITNDVYNKRWNKFLKNDEAYQNELAKKSTAEGQALTRVLAQVHNMASKAEKGESAINLTSKFYTPLNVGKASGLAKTIVNFSNLEAGSRPIKAGDSKGAYEALDKMFNIVQNPESDEYKFANELTDNIYKMFENPKNRKKAKYMLEQYGALREYRKLFTDVSTVKNLLTSAPDITEDQFLNTLQEKKMGDMVLKFFKADPTLFNFYQMKLAPKKEI